MSARVKPTQRPSRAVPAVLGALIAVVGFATLMIRLEVTREGYRLPMKSPGCRTKIAHCA